MTNTIPKVGHYIEVDGWDGAGVVLSESPWAGAAFSARAPRTGAFFCCDVEVTGRDLSTRRASDDGLWVRVRLTFVNDSDIRPHATAGGWLRFDRRIFDDGCPVEVEVDDETPATVRWRAHTNGIARRLRAAARAIGGVEEWGR